MKTAEQKPVSTTTRAKPDKPFFSKTGEGGFFGKGKQEFHPFFNPASGYSVNANGILQTKLTVGQPGDKYEKEADEMANKVVQRLANPQSLTTSGTAIQTKPIAASITPLIQAKCAHCLEEEKSRSEGANGTGDKNVVQRKCAECEKEEKLQKKSDSTDTSIASPHIEGKLNASKGGGAPIPHAVKGQMENSFGMDFSNVRLHTGSSAVQMNQDLHAQAFTHGSDIYFNSGKYDVSGAKGKHLLAHELTHVVQQGAGIAAKIQRLGDLSKVPPMPCPVANTSSAGALALTSLFPTSSTSLSPDQKNDIATFVISWKASGGTDTLRVDGYASTIGADELNWRLSCERAFAVANELQINGVPNNMIEFFAQGETSEFGLQGNNQRADITMIAPPPVPKITSETVVRSPGSRERTTIGVGEEVNLTHSLGGPSTAWTTTAGSLSAATGATVLFTAPDTKQNVTITADGASITFRVLAPNAVHMDNVGAVVKHHNNLPDSGILTDVFLLPDNVNFSKVTYRELDVVGVPTPGVYSCNTFSGGHCAPAGLGPCGDKAVTDTVVAGKGTKSVLGDCAYSGHCGGAPPFAPGSITVTIPYQYKVGAGRFRRFSTVTQLHVLAADASTLTTDKAGAMEPLPLVLPQH